MTAKADVVHAASGSPTAIEAAVDEANAGDTVQIPAGTFAFLGTVIINKSITLQGAGQTETVLVGENLDNAGMLRVTADNVTISDMTVRGRPQGSGRIQDVGISFRGIDFVAQRLTIQDFGAVGISASGADVRGVISHCRFIDIYREEIANLGYGVYVSGGGGLNWERPFVLGSQEFVFVEDSYFTGNRHDIASSQGSRYVYRHNESENAPHRGQHVDTHGAEYGAEFSSRGVEVYNNVIRGAAIAILIRGGDGAIFGNTFEPQTTQSIVVANRTDGSSTCDYPNAGQTTDMYVWDNSSDGGPEPFTVRHACLFEEGRDYHFRPPTGYVPYPYPHPLVGAAVEPGARNTCEVTSSPSGIVPVEISVSAHDGNGPCNLVDGDWETRWSAEGDGQWAQLDLGVMTTVNQLQAAFYQGNERTSRFDLQVSGDGVAWTDVLTDATSGGASLELETFRFADQSARFVRYVGHGNSIAGNDWNSIAEMRIVFEAPASTDGGDVAGGMDGGADSGPTFDGGPGFDGGPATDPTLGGGGCTIAPNATPRGAILVGMLLVFGLRRRRRGSPRPVCRQGARLGRVGNMRLPFLALLLAIGCQGNIMDPGNTDPEVMGPGALPPGSVVPEESVLRRLNLREYQHTVRDLFDIDVTALLLPDDARNARSFDTDGSALRLTLSDADRYFEAADTIARFVVENGDAPLPMCAGLMDAALHACVEENLPAFLTRAFRQPVDANTVAQVRMLTSTDESYEAVVQSIVLSTLISPYFLFHYKTPAAERDSGVDAYELAGSLSYFLWSSMPDAELHELAASGALLDPSVLEAQAERLLVDPKSERFFGEFTVQWLAVKDFQRNAATQEEADLFVDMEEETRRFALRILTANEPLVRLMDSRETVLNERLATHYDVEWPAGDEEWRVVTMPPERTGILAQGSMLAARSLGGGSNPFVRGAWTAENILCVEAPPPPPDVESLPAETGEPQTVRQLIERHQSNPECGACHRGFDYFGIAFEQFDAYGRYREAYDFGEPVDASGELPDGRTFDGLAGLAGHLAEESTFTDCVGELLATYALGRNIRAEHAESVLEGVELGPEVRMTDIVLAIITHEEFTGVTP